MENFKITVEDAFNVQGLGVIIAGIWNEKGTIGAGDIIRGFDEKFYRILAVTYFPKPGQNKIGLRINCNYQQAKSLIGFCLTKK
jgi:hypothetical protein